MQINSTLSNVGRLSRWRVGIVGLGYLVALAGALSMFSVSLYMTILLVVAGAVIVTQVSQRAPAVPMTWKSWVAFLAGCAVILGVLTLFGQERVRHWWPHPAGYTLAWYVCFMAFRHLRGLVVHGQPNAAQDGVKNRY